MLANGTNWEKFGTGLPNVQCAGLEINYVINKIRIGLYGRGVWEHSLACPTDFDLTFNTTINLGFYEAENNIYVDASVNSVTNSGDITARAGNQIVVTAPGANKVTFNPKTTLFIHPCNHSGNSFKQQHTIYSGDQTASNTVKDIEQSITEDGTVKFTYYPNPFTDHLHIDFLLAQPSDVKVSVYNSFGQVVETLAGSRYEAGEYTLSFSNPSLNPGVYCIKMDFGDKHFTKAVLKISSE